MQTTYWGVLCRKCLDPVVFGSPSHPQFELESEFARPGTIRCANGHDYIYFPRDFKFFPAMDEIPEAIMERNREAHRTVNPLHVVSSKQTYGKRWVPEQAKQAAVPIPPPAKPAIRDLRASGGPDPRRESAQAAAKAMWTKWAARKVS